MGFRTVVMLNNDQAHEWQNDPLLGQKIVAGMNHISDEVGSISDMGYGRVVECQHADTVTLVRLGFYKRFEPLAYGSYKTDNLDLLKEAAATLGYRLVKKS